MVVNPAFLSSVPPSFIGRPLLYMATLASFMLVNLLALEWMWRLVWSLIERPAAVREPASSARMIHLLLIVSILARAGPFLVFLMAWPDIGPAARQNLAITEKALASLSFIPFSIAWIGSYLSGPMITYQLMREPLPVHLWPTWHQAQRPLKIGVGVAVIAFALTYLR